jgi:hypothetical protein
MLKYYEPEIACEAFISAIIIAGIPEWYDVPRIPADDHDRKNPVDELIAMRGTDEGLHVVEHE